MVSSTNDAELVRAAQAGNHTAFSTLFERWFDRSYDVAWRIVRNRDTAAEVAQDTFLTAFTKLDTLRDPEAFGGWVLRTARNKALNRLEREGRSRPTDTEDAVDLADRDRTAVDIADEIVRQEHHDLVWAAAAALGERDASILDLHLRHDLEPAQIAEALDITPNAAHQTLFRLRKRLEGAIRSYVLWNDGAPVCGELAAALDGAAISSFGPAAVKAISGHVAACDACDERHTAILSPSSMFAAVPFVVVGAGIREAAAAELVSHGIPIDLAVSGRATGSGSGPASAEDNRGLWQINRSSGPATKGAVAVAAVVVFVVGLVAGASMLGDGVDTELVAGTTVLDTTTAPPTSSPTSSPTSTPTTGVETTTDAATAGPTDSPATSEPPTSPPPPSSTGSTVPETAPPDTTAPDRPSTTGSTGSSSTTEAPPAPVVVRFAIGVDGGSCGVRGVGTIHALSWHVDHADSVTLAGTPTVPAGPHDPADRVLVCLLPDQFGGWTLTATGAGGAATATASTTG